MKGIKRFEDLPVWKDAVELAAEIYQFSDNGRLSKDYGTKDQIRRASLSISNNISEGFEYDNNREFIKYLRYAKGSAGEVRSMINVLFKIKYIDRESYKHYYNKVTALSKQIRWFIKY